MVVLRVGSLDSFVSGSGSAAGGSLGSLVIAGSGESLRFVSSVLRFLRPIRSGLHDDDRRGSGHSGSGSSLSGGGGLSGRHDLHGRLGDADDGLFDNDGLRNRSFNRDRLGNRNGDRSGGGVSVVGDGGLGADIRLLRSAGDEHEQHAENREAEQRDHRSEVVGALGILDGLSTRALHIGRRIGGGEERITAEGALDDAPDGAGDRGDRGDPAEHDGTANLALARRR